MKSSPRFEAAAGVLDAGIRGIERFLEEYNQVAQASRVGELTFLRRWKEEILTKIGNTKSATAEAPPAPTLVDRAAELQTQIELAIVEERYEDAAPFVETAAQDAAVGDLVSQIVWRTAKENILADAGDLDGAERLGREAIAIAEQTDLINDRAECWIHLARVLEQAGRHGEAAEAARTALELYERKGNVVSAGRVRARLERLEHRAPS